jgi:hypothetical protein
MLATAALDLTEIDLIVANPQAMQAGGAERENDAGHIAVGKMLRIGDHELGAHFREVGCDTDQVTVAFLRAGSAARYETRLTEVVRGAGEVGIDVTGLEIEAAVAVHDPAVVRGAGTSRIERARLRRCHVWTRD